MLGAVATEIGERGEVHAFGDLGERQAFVSQIVFEYGNGVAVDVGGDTMACHAFDGGRKIFGRNIQSLCIVTHITLRSADAGSKQSHQLLHDVGGAVGMGVCGITLGMNLEDVVHHCKTQAAHQFAIELHVAITHTVTQTMEIIQQVLRLFVGEFDDRVLIQRFTLSGIGITTRSFFTIW